MLCLRSDEFPFGEGLFETLKQEDGGLPYFDLHWNRLAGSAKALGLPFPFQEEKIREALRASCGPVLRLVYRLKEEKPGLFIQQLRRDPPGPTLTLLPRSWEPHPLAAYKTTNRQAYEEAWRSARAAGADDALLYLEHGRLLEMTRANIFAVQNGMLKTPRADGSLLPGVMRAVVIRRAQKLGIEIREELVRLEDLRKCSEIFVTNSVMGIKPVSKVVGWWESAFLGAGTITQKLLTNYNNLL